jgi:hypothetical protein
VGGVQITFDLSELGQIKSRGYQRAKSTAQQEYSHDEPEIHGLSALQSVTGNRILPHLLPKPLWGSLTHQEMVKNSQCPKTNFRRGLPNVKKMPILSKIQTAMDSDNGTIQVGKCLPGVKAHKKG